MKGLLHVHPPPAFGGSQGTRWMVTQMPGHLYSIVHQWFSALKKNFFFNWVTLCSFIILFRNLICKTNKEEIRAGLMFFLLIAAPTSQVNLGALFESYLKTLLHTCKGADREFHGSQICKISVSQTLLVPAQTSSVGWSPCTIPAAGSVGHQQLKAYCSSRALSLAFWLSLPWKLRAPPSLASRRSNSVVPSCFRALSSQLHWALIHAQLLFPASLSPCLCKRTLSLPTFYARIPLSCFQGTHLRQLYLSFVSYDSYIAQIHRSTGWWQTEGNGWMDNMWHSSRMPFQSIFTVTSQCQDAPWYVNALLTIQYQQMPVLFVCVCVTRRERIRNRGPAFGALIALPHLSAKFR